jgi:predicted nucleotidyltransferase
MITVAGSKDEIFHTLAAHWVEVQSFGVKRLGLFGSALHCEIQIAGDLDFLVEFHSGRRTFNNFMDLCFFLEDAFHKDVDLVTLESLSEHVRPRILQEVEFAPFDEN